MTWSNLNITNPWANISCKNVFASQDYNYPVTVGKGKNLKQLLFGTSTYVKEINKLFSKAGLTYTCLPEPYSGNPDANVYCLNMNPGAPDSRFDTNPLAPNPYTQRALDNLNHNVSDAFWTEGLVKDSNGIIYVDKTLFLNLFNSTKATNSYYIHAGARWQREKTKELRNELNGRNPNIFFLEYFPYHSIYGFDFPNKLPSYDYRNALLEYALNEEKIIIIMRKENLWYGISDRNIGYRLKRYKKKILIKNSQGGWLTRNNMLLPIPDFRCDSLSWNDIISKM